MCSGMSNGYAEIMLATILFIMDNALKAYSHILPWLDSKSCSVNI
jgi:hypothetical protein